MQAPGQQAGRAHISGKASLFVGFHFHLLTSSMQEPKTTQRSQKAELLPLEQYLMAAGVRYKRRAERGKATVWEPKLHPVLVALHQNQWLALEWCSSPSPAAPEDHRPCLVPAHSHVPCVVLDQSAPLTMGCAEDQKCPLLMLKFMLPIKYIRMTYLVTLLILRDRHFSVTNSSLYAPFIVI